MQSVQRAGSLLGLEQRYDVCIQDFRQSVQDQKRRVLEAAFQLTDIRPVNVGLQG